jgi:hypothetical protein
VCCIYATHYFLSTSPNAGPQCVNLFQGCGMPGVVLEISRTNVVLGPLIFCWRAWPLMLFCNG